MDLRSDGISKAHTKKKTNTLTRAILPCIVLHDTNMYYNCINGFACVPYSVAIYGEHFMCSRVKSRPARANQDTFLMVSSIASCSSCGDIFAFSVLSA